MKYWQPYGVSDPNGGYTNGNPATGTMGSIPPAGSIEEPQREIVNAISAAGLTPTAAQYTQLLESLRLHLDRRYSVDDGTGGVNVIRVDIAPRPDAYRKGLEVVFVPANTNTSAAATLSVMGIAGSQLGPKTLKRSNGDALESGDLVAGYAYTVVYDSTNFRIVSGAGQVMKVAGGKPSFLRVNRSSQASFPNAGWGMVSGMTTLHSQLNAGSSWNGSRLVLGAKDAGLWFFAATAIMTTEELAAFVYVNGTGGDMRNADGYIGELSYGRYCQLAAFYPLNAGQYIEFFVYQRNTAASSKTLDTFDAGCHLITT